MVTNVALTRNMAAFARKQPVQIYIGVADKSLFTMKAPHRTVRGFCKEAIKARPSIL
jgi:hypothetical protein